MVKCVCGKFASFNIRGEKKGRFCFKHKESSMVNVKHITCEIEKCDTRPSFNFRGEIKGRFCVFHKAKF